MQTKLLNISIAILLIVVHLPDTDGQISYGGTPARTYKKAYKPVPVIDMPKFDVQKIKKEHAENAVIPHAKALKFAHSFDVYYSPMNSGTWKETQNGTKVWTTGIKSEGAYSINIIFSEYKLPPGARVFVYDKDKEHVLGAFTHMNNKESGILPVSPIPGDELYIELQVPENVTFQPRLAVGKVSHDYLGFFDFSGKDGSFGESGDCNMDIMCYEDTEIQKVKYAVCRLIVKGNELCTGTLVNNSKNDGTPYLLTANHCISSSSIASNALFYFDYESPTCGGGDGSTAKSIAGSTLKATTRYLDFSLVELSVSPPFTYKPYYAGWNTDTSGITKAYTIHHPSGDVKKISIEEDKPVIGNFGGGYDQNSFWLIKDWEIGTTEGGSSGGPLFDQNYRLIGDLTGGTAQCGNSIDDYFTQFARAWNDYPDANNQLKYWLDPLKSDSKSIPGFDPYEDVRKSTYIKSNVAENENFELYAVNNDWGYYSGHNSLKYEQFAEKFTSSSELSLIGLFVNAGKKFAVSSYPKVKIQIWKDHLNEDNIIAEKYCDIKEFKENQDFYLEFDSLISLKGDFFVGYRLFYTYPQDSFAVNLAKNRTNNVNTAYMYSEVNGWQSLTEASKGIINSSLAIKLVVNDNEILNSRPVKKNESFVECYPNPVKDDLYFRFESNPNDNIHVSIFDIRGRMVIDKFIYTTTRELKVNTSSLTRGFYFFRINNHKISTSGKFAVIK